MGVLDGTRVVELGNWVAGPSAGGIMADWGADVVKIESPAGDPFRTVFGTIGLDPNLPVPPFALDNRGKRSVVLDLSKAEAREATERLIGGADVFLTNIRPDALGRLGLDPHDVTARHPRLVYASVTGYGLDGPDRDRPGYDVGAFWARTGIATQLVPPARRRRAFVVAWATTPPESPPWPASWPRCWSASAPGVVRWWRHRCCERACTAWGGTSACNWSSARWRRRRPGRRTPRLW